MQFGSISSLIDRITEAEAKHQKSINIKLFLQVTYINDQLRLFDCQKVQLLLHQDDFQSYLDLQVYRIKSQSTICLNCCKVSLELTSKNQIESFYVQSKDISINCGTKNQEKLKEFQLKLYAEVISNSSINIKPSTIKYLRRSQKEKQVLKYWDNNNSIDILNFITPININQNITKNQYPYLDNLTNLDSVSKDILLKLVSFVDKEQLLRFMIKKPLRGKNSKKLIRMMVFPNEISADVNDMKLIKRRYDKESIAELINDYKNFDQ